MNWTGQLNVVVPVPAFSMLATVSVAFSDATNCVPPAAFKVILPTVAEASSVISAGVVMTSSSVAGPAGAGVQLEAVARLPLAPPIQV